MCQPDMIIRLIVVLPESFVNIAKSKIFCISVLFLVFTLKKCNCLICTLVTLFPSS